MILVGALTGAVIGLGILLLLTPASRRRVHPRRHALQAVGQTVAAFAAGGPLVVATGWWAGGIAFGILAGLGVGALRRQQEEQRAVARREALAEVAGRLRDALQANMGLPQAIALTCQTGPAALASELTALEEGLRIHGVERALARFGRAAGDPLFRGFARTVGHAYRVGGAQLSDLLGALAEAAARQAATSREIAARQGPHRLAATLIAAVAVGVLLYVRWKSPAYMAAYGTPDGQAWMGLGFGLITAGYWALLRLGRLPGGGT